MASGVLGSLDQKSPRSLRDLSEVVTQESSQPLESRYEVLSRREPAIARCARSAAGAPEMLVLHEGAEFVGVVRDERPIDGLRPVRTHRLQPQSCEVGVRDPSEMYDLSPSRLQGARKIAEHLVSAISKAAVWMS